MEGRELPSPKACHRKDLVHKRDTFAYVIERFSFQWNSP